MIETETETKVVPLYAPAEAHRFRFRIESDTDMIVTKEVISVTADYLNKEITVLLRQPRTSPDLHDFLIKQAEHEQLVFIDTMTGQTDLPSLIQQFHVQLIEHKYHLTYEADDVAQHLLVFKIL